MSQSAVPNSDVATGLWTPTPVYPQIRQLLTGDPNFVTSSQDPTSDTFIVKLSGVAWPAAGPEVLKIRLQNTTSSLVIATISLFDGSTLIGTWTVQPPMGFTTYKLPLTAGQIAAITNYANLEVQVTAHTGGIYLVQTATGAVDSALNMTVNFSRPTTAGNFLVAAIGWNTIDPSLTGWSYAANHNGAGPSNCAIWYLPNAPSVSSVAFVYGGGSSGGMAVVIAEYAGIATSAPLDRGVGVGGTSNPVSTPSTGTLAQANELVLGVASVCANGRTFTSPTSPFVIEGQILTTSAAKPASMCLLRNIVSATTSLSCSVTDSSNGDLYSAGICSFK